MARYNALRLVHTTLATMRTARRAREVVEEARDILSGNGIPLEYTVALRFADMEAVYTFEGADFVQSLIVGREIAGFSGVLAVRAYSGRPFPNVEWGHDIAGACGVR